MAKGPAGKHSCREPDLPMTGELDLMELLGTEMWQSPVAKLLSETPECGREEVSLCPLTTRRLLAKAQETPLLLWLGHR
jgi:hypothetical protein